VRGEGTSERGVSSTYVCVCVCVCVCAVVAVEAGGSRHTSKRFAYIARENDICTGCKVDTDFTVTQ